MGRQTPSNIPKKLHRTARRTPKSARVIEPPAEPPPGILDYAEYAESEITPALCRSFDALLLTYHIRELRGEVALPRIDDRLHEWKLEYEGMYGDGHYVERKRLLYETLGKVMCVRHADAKAIHINYLIANFELPICHRRSNAGLSEMRRRLWERSARSG